MIRTITTSLSHDPDNYNKFANDDRAGMSVWTESEPGYLAVDSVNLNHCVTFLYQLFGKFWFATLVLVSPK